MHYSHLVHPFTNAVKKKNQALSLREIHNNIQSLAQVYNNLQTNSHRNNNNFTKLCRPILKMCVILFFNLQRSGTPHIGLRIPVQKSRDPHSLARSSLLKLCKRR